jgi:mRNA interferase MazF
MKWIAPNPRKCFATWRLCVRGEVHRLNAPRGTRGHKQSGTRCAVVVQSDDLPLSTWLVAPTSTSARHASFRPEVEIEGRTTRVLAEQTAAIDPGRLGPSVGYLSRDEIRRVDAALRIVLEL